MSFFRVDVCKLIRINLVNDQLRKLEWKSGHKPIYFLGTCSKQKIVYNRITLSP